MKKLPNLIYSNMGRENQLLFNEAAEILYPLFLKEENEPYLEAFYEIINKKCIPENINIQFIFLWLYVSFEIEISINEITVGNITQNQYKILFAIYYFKYNTITQLKEYFSKSGSCMSILIQKLENKGYIIKEFNDEDRRLVYLNLTKQGIELLDNLTEKVNQIIVKKIFEKNFEEKEKVNLAFDKIIESIS